MHLGVSETFVAVEPFSLSKVVKNGVFPRLITSLLYICFEHPSLKDQTTFKTKIASFKTPCQNHIDGSTYIYESVQPSISSQSYNPIIILMCYIWAKITHIMPNSVHFKPINNTLYILMCCLWASYV